MLSLMSVLWACGCKVYIFSYFLLHFHAVIETLKRHPDGRDFIEFVKEERAEGYYKTIIYPMCLNEIRDRINRHQCDTCEDVRHACPK